LVRILTIILLFTVLGAESMAQASKWDKSKEMGVVIGTSYYIGDINPSKHFGTRLNGGGGLVYRDNLSKRWSIKASFLYGRVEAFDSDSDDPWQLNRNLSFRNEILEGSVQAELNYFDYQIGNENHPISPYVFAGLAYYSMKPQGEYNGNWYELQPMGTEGQGTSEGGSPYSTTGISAPFGLGLKVNMFSIIALSLEWGMRKTWTDYFDDVSGVYINPTVLIEENGRLASEFADQSFEQTGVNGTNEGAMRGDPGRNDWYNFTHLAITFRLGKSPTTCWK
jgi:hypothetical protein